MKYLRFFLTAAAASSAAPGMAQTAANLAPGQSVTGELSVSDTQRRSGKYEDAYTFAGTRGQRVQLDLGAEGFDTYLVVTGPNGFFLANDDVEGGGDETDSRIVFEVPADGAYRIAATSYRPGETGPYRIAASVPAANVAITRPVAAQPIRIGQNVRGTLQDGDGRLASGEFTDRYRFSARRGQRVTIALTGNKLDPYLLLARPDGTSDANDDSRIDGQPSLNSRIDTVLAEDGDYVVTVTSYRPGETGDYQLSIQPSAGS
ncbi:MAG TPA: PPC domain-containing protein, partial [Allosphingosinicella sp.]|nr:PPC domain-containing protein [Allosphingosinicella sp.]